MHSSFRLCLTLAAIAAMVSCRHAQPANIAAAVNDRPISFAEVDKQYAIQFPQNSAASNDDQTLINKLEVLRAMVDQEIMMQRAEKASLLATEAEIETDLNKYKSPYTQEEFQRQLAAKKMSFDDLKAEIRKKLTIDKLINKEITSKIVISDKDVADFYNSNKSSFNLAEPQVHLAQILVTATPDENVRNLKNDKAQNDDQARRKIQSIESRLRNGEDFATLAQNYSEDSGSSANGGDLGFISESALEKANVELRRLVISMQPGQISQILKTNEGYRILRLISREPAGQRELSDPRVFQMIRETLQNRKDQLLRAAYIEVVRNEAKVENYLAGNIAQLNEKK